MYALASDEELESPYVGAVYDSVGVSALASDEELDEELEPP